MDTGNSGTMSEQAVDAPAEGRAAWPPDRTRDASLDVGCDPHRCHDQCRGFRNSRLGPGRTLTPPAPAALRQMAPDVVCDALRVPRSSRCTPPETPAAVHDSIALQGIYLTVRVPVDTHKAVETVETDPRVFDIEAALESSFDDLARQKMSACASNRPVVQVLTVPVTTTPCVTTLDVVTSRYGTENQQ
jgi:hypothetical protein